MKGVKMKNKKKVKAYSISKEESDTYDLKDRKEKESILESDIISHWNTRAKRPDVQSVMSARHTLGENVEATKILQKDIFEFLQGYIEGKNVFELGVGIGRNTKEIAKIANNVIGCDISDIMLQRARDQLLGYDNVELYLGKITELDLAENRFDLVFESIVLLHILNPEELRKTVERMKQLSDVVFLLEHTYEGPDFPISKYSILRKPEEYAELFKPYRLVKQKTHYCAGDNFTMMLFEK